MSQTFQNKRTAPLKTKDSSKAHLKPGTLLYPAPVVLVSCMGESGEKNLITIGWTGIICTHPPMLSISIRPERYSYALIKQTKEFVVNLPTRNMAWMVDYCGMKSGKDLDKWALMKAKTNPSQVVQVPQLSESPVSLECKVQQIIPLGSHDCFLSEIVGVSVHEALLDKKGMLHLEEADLIAFVHSYYVGLEKPLAKFGFSIKKNE